MPSLLCSVTTDNFLAQGSTNQQGYFTLRGKENLITSMDPKLNVYHKCDDRLVWHMASGHSL
jgi:hypothetical protein